MDFQVKIVVLGISGVDCHNVGPQEERNLDFKISDTGGDCHGGTYR